MWLSYKGAGQTLLGGLAIPLHRFGVVLGNAHGWIRKCKNEEFDALSPLAIESG